MASGLEIGHWLLFNNIGITHGTLLGYSLQLWCFFMLCKGHYQLARKSEKKNMKFGVAPFSLPKKRLRGELILTSLRYLNNRRLSDNRGLLVYHTKAQVSAAGWIQSKIDSNCEANPVLTITNYGNSFVKDMDGSVTKILKSKVSFYMILWNLSRNYELDTDVLEWNYLAYVIQKVVLQQCLQRKVLWTILLPLVSRPSSLLENFKGFTD